MKARIRLVFNTCLIQKKLIIDKQITWNFNTVYIFQTPLPFYANKIINPFLNSLLYYMYLTFFSYSEAFTI